MVKKRAKRDYVFIEQKGRGKLSQNMILTMSEYRKGVKRRKSWSGKK